MAKLSLQLEETVKRAYADARDNWHEFVSIEHLLFAMTEDKTVIDVLEVLHIEVPSFREQLRQLITQNIPVIPEAFRDQPQQTRIQATDGFHSVINRTIKNADKMNQKEINSIDVLPVIFATKDSAASYLLRRHGIIFSALMGGIIAVSLKSIAQNSQTDAQKQAGKNTQKNKEEQTDPLAQFTLHLNKEAQEGRLDPLVGRKDELLRMMQVLCRRRKNNPLLVGEAGVGKTALAEGLAWKIVQQDVPEILREVQIYALDMGALLAGTKYRGDLEGRIKAVLKALEKVPHAVLFIDEIHNIIGAGSSENRTVDVSSLLKPALANGQLRCIGATTYQEYRAIFDRDHALNRRFQKIDIPEPTIDETVAILQGLQPALEKHHRVVYTENAVRKAAELSQRYITERFLPDKAIDVLDEAGAAHQVRGEQDQEIVDVEEIEKVLAKIARIPEQTVSQDDKQVLKNLSGSLKEQIFGQDAAIEVLTDAVKLSRSGLGALEKPTGSFLFAGPTGVGKTEVARALAKQLNVPLLRFDMSEYMEQHAVSRLIGAPPGYVGFDKGGQLTDAVHQQPNCVLLLDELEKAHSDVFNILLQIMDYGMLTDNNGRHTDFRHVILIMTTNAGAEMWSKNSIGFTQEKSEHDQQEALNRFFTPEFRNRLDAIVSFKPLSREVMTQIVDKFLNELRAQLKEQSVLVSFSKATKNYLAEHGFDPKMGARPLKRLIQNVIRKPLADELLFGRLTQGGNISIDINQNGEAKIHLRKPNAHRKSKKEVSGEQTVVA